MAKHNFSWFKLEETEVNYKGSKNVWNNNIGNTMYTLFQSHLKTTIQIRNKVS
jgi:hypothetical protein